MTSMTMYSAPASPFARKAAIVAHELSLFNDIRLMKCAPGPVARDSTIVEYNPLGQIPTLFGRNGEAFFDSRVICEYLDSLDGKDRMFPKGEMRWQALRDQTIGDGIMDAAILVRYETWLRPEQWRWKDWELGQIDKVRASVAMIEKNVAVLGKRVDIGTITVACSLSYLDFRFSQLSWRSKAPAASAWLAEFSQRPSMKATEPMENPVVTQTERPS